MFAEVTGVNEQLIKRMYVLLSVLNGGYTIFSGKYAEYAKDTAKLYIDTYPWYYMPLGVHKMLIHGEEVCNCVYIANNETCPNFIHYK